MKVSRTAAVLCAIAVTAASASADVKTEAGKNSNKNGQRALRGGADQGKTAKKKHPETKKRALKAKDEASSDEATGTGTGGENRAFTTGATASTRYNNQAVASTYQQGSNAGYGNNKYGYLDRYEQYLTPEQLERLRNPGAAAAAATGSDDEEDVGGTEQPVQTRPVPTTVASPARPVTTASSSYQYTQTAATEPQQQVPNTVYVSAPELNRASEAGPAAGALNRNPLEAEAPIQEYDETTGYGVVGSSSNANANSNANVANTNSNGGALNRQQPVPAVQTTAWKPITQDVWVEHHVPGVPTRPAWDTGDSAATWSNNANKPSNAGGTSAASANSAGSYVPNRNPSANAAASNRIPVADAPCDGTNTAKSPSPGIEHVFSNRWDRFVGWGSCANTRSDCPPGECCFASDWGAACIPFSEICEPGETPGSGDCPYPWMTSDRCLCGGDDPLL